MDNASYYFLFTNSSFQQRAFADYCGLFSMPNCTYRIKYTSRMMLHDPHTNRLFFINKENLQANSIVRSQDSSLPISTQE